MESKINYIPGDPLLIQNIVSQLKSQGVFDQFRKECISDVDTKPAYQNLCHRVDGEVECYLSDVKWVPDLNKNQLRESIRKYINERTFVDSGITRIVDQLVNPRINTVLVPKVADIVCNYLGIEKIDFEVSNNCKNTNNQITDEYNKFPLDQSGVSVSKDSKLLDQNCGKYGKDVKSEYNTSNVKNQPKELDYSENLAPEQHIKTEPNKNEETEHYIGNVSTTRKHGLDACSDIDSDDDDISPPYEPHQKSDVESVESDYSMDVQGDDVAQVVNVKTEIENDKIDLNTESICREGSTDAINSSLGFETNRDVFCVDIPSTPTINYETDDNEDSFSRKNIEPFEQMRDQGGRPDEITHIDNGTIRNHVANPKCKEKETDKDESKRKIESLKYRDRKHSAHRKNLSKSSARREKYHHISITEKDRSRDQSKTHSSKYKTDKTDRQDRPTNKGKEKDSKRKPSSNEKHKVDKKNSCKVDPKNDLKKRSSSSKHGSDKDRRRSKHSKEENSNLKKNKSQCSEDRKIRSDRRSSDRDSNGPSSSSRHSSHCSSSKNDKESQSKCRHSSSSSSSSHKSKKTAESGDRMRSEEMDDDSTKGDDPSKDTNPMNVDPSKDTNPMNVDPSKDTNLINVYPWKDTNSMNVDSIDQRSDERAPTESVKKPKIARNASDILRIIELRKQYREKMKLTQQGKENTDSEFGSKPEFNEKSVLGKRFSMNALKESIDNCVSNNYDKNVESENGEESSIDSLINLHDEIKVNIRRVDSDFKLMNGSCLMVSPNGEDGTLLISNELCTNTVGGNVNNNYVKTGGTGYSISKTPIEPNQSLCYIKEECLKINGFCTNIVKSFPSLKSEPCQETTSENHPKISTKENDWKSRLLSDVDDVRYLESSEHYAEFQEFVATTIRESEQIYLENFSIFIKCPERYDEVLRSKLVAIVKRKGKVPLLPSPVKYNSEIISNAEGNDRSIMMRIKKTVTGSECAVSSNQNLGEGNSTNSAVVGSIKAVPVVFNEVNSGYNVTHGDSQQMEVVTKRKTFGIKRKLSYGSKMNKSFDTRVKGMDDNSKYLGGNVDVCHGIRASYEEEASKITGALHLSESSNLKIPKRDTGPKLVNGIDSKRRQFYYDKGDLYKPHRSFLASSRRSRNLNPD